MGKGKQKAVRILATMTALGIAKMKSQNVGKKLRKGGEETLKRNTAYSGILFRSDSVPLPPLKASSSSGNGTERKYILADALPFPDLPPAPILQVKESLSGRRADNSSHYSHCSQVQVGTSDPSSCMDQSIEAPSHSPKLWSDPVEKLFPTFFFFFGNRIYYKKRNYLWYWQGPKETLKTPSWKQVSVKSFGPCTAMQRRSI